MINKPLPFKGRNIRMFIIISIKGRWLIDQCLGLVDAGLFGVSKNVYEICDHNDCVF